MNTEEDTFDALRRTPIRKLITRWNASPRHADEFPSFLLKHGWTYEEWTTELKKINERR